MANALSKYQSVLKRVRKEHPKMSFKAAQDKASKLYKMGAKPAAKKKVGAPKRKTAAPRKKSITKTVRVSSVGARKVKRTGIQSAISISRKIDDLESVLRNTTGTEAKNRIKRLINAEHDKLDLITKKSA